MKIHTPDLKSNAITSIRLGIEDFNQSKNSEGDSARAISATRNLFSGILLLLKYRLIKKYEKHQESISFPAFTNENSNALILDFRDKKTHRDFAPYIIEHEDDVLGKIKATGGIVWKTEKHGQFKILSWPNDFTKLTINLVQIKKRYESLGINIDWVVIDKLNKERNNIEHAHPSVSYRTIAEFISDTFLFLCNFIDKELEENPKNLLNEAFYIMEKEKNIYEEISKQCRTRWKEIGLPPRIHNYLDLYSCYSCGSKLIAPNENQLVYGLTIDSHNLEYSCKMCGHSEEIHLILNETFIMENHQKTISTCRVCDHDFVIQEEGLCYWCEDEFNNK